MTVGFSDPDSLEIMDTTLRDGEQCFGVSFNLQEKLVVSKFLLEELKVDRIEIASARVSEKELEAVKAVCSWAKERGFLEKVEVLGFVDGNRSADWLNEAGCKTINLLAKGSERHCRTQLKKSPKEHFEGIERELDYCKGIGISANVYLEDWGNGMLESRQYVLELVEFLEKCGTKRIMLADTLGVLVPEETGKFVLEAVEKFSGQHFDFHAHNDYGLAAANSLAAIQAGARGVHCTVNGLGERAGNAALEEISVIARDKAGKKIGIAEEKLGEASALVEGFSRQRVSFNKPVVGKNVFVQTAGVHADGELKGLLYTSRLNAKRFGKDTVYALGKLSGLSSIEINLKKLGLDLEAGQKKEILKKVVELGEKKNAITMDDFRTIAENAVGEEKKAFAKVADFHAKVGLGTEPEITVKIEANGKTVECAAKGNGAYDAFMNALKALSEKNCFKIAELADYEVRIPRGGGASAIVEAIILWRHKGKEFSTIGIDTDQLTASIKATEKMLNIVNRGG